MYVSTAMQASFTWCIVNMTVLDAVGGIMGYKKKRSKDSLIASSIIAGLLLSSAYLMGKPNTTYGVRLALGIHPVPLSTLPFDTHYAIC